jgi:hypothetical protein
MSVLIEDQPGRIAELHRVKEMHDNVVQSRVGSMKTDTLMSLKRGVMGRTRQNESRGEKIVQPFKSDMGKCRSCTPRGSRLFVTRLLDQGRHFLCIHDAVNIQQDFHTAADLGHPEDIIRVQTIAETRRFFDIARFDV